MELRHLRYFVAVAEEESIARAAKRLHVSEPPLSRQMRDLEDHLGVVLLTRGPRSIRLTDAGRRFLPEARAVLARVGQAMTTVRGKGKAIPAPFVRIGILGPGHVSCLRKESARLRAARPDAEIHFESANPAALLERLRAGQLDAVCLDVPLPPEAQSQVNAGAWGNRTIYRTPMIAVLPSGHRLASGRRVALAALAQDDFVLPARTGQVSLGERCLVACRQAGFEPRVMRWIEGPPSGVVVAVASGSGVSVLSAPLRAVHLPGVVYRSLEPPVPSIDYALVWDHAVAPAEGWLWTFVKPGRRAGTGVTAFKRD